MAGKNFKSLAQKVFFKVLNGSGRSNLINLETEFREYFKRDMEDDSELVAVKRFIFKECEVLSNQSFPVPIYQSSTNDKMLLTWFHPAYETYSDISSPNDAFFDIYNWVRQCDGNEFLLVCAAYLASLQSKKIFITDSVNDGGVDLIAINNMLGQIPTLFLVQAKTKKNSRISREVLLQEVGKFHNLPQKEIYNKYFQHVNRQLNGCSFTHVLMTNCHFNDDAMKEAFFSKSIFINDLRLSLAISKKYSLQQIFEVGDIIKKDRNSSKFEFDLSYNVAERFFEIANM